MFNTNPIFEPYPEGEDTCCFPTTGVGIFNSDNSVVVSVSPGRPHSDVHIGPKYTLKQEYDLYLCIYLYDIYLDNSY